VFVEQQWCPKFDRQRRNNDQLGKGLFVFLPGADFNSKKNTGTLSAGSAG
jgi:hypothetical protein